MEKKIFVPDMHCEHCVKRISDALNEKKIEFSVDLSSQTVTINGCDNCLQTAFDEIYDLGFSPEKM